MEVVSQATSMQQKAFRWIQEGNIVALVPTMGALHEGHMSLLREGRQRGDVLVMSLFVNPTQFGSGEDFDSYPREFDKDKEKAASCGVDVLFAPAASEVYPQGFQTHVEVEQVTQGLCGAHRPGHFRGVCTVVAQLFHLVLPDVAILGEKDYQQLVTIKRMVQDLHFPVQIVGVPTVRDADGLAMSSRNKSLTATQRRAAAGLYRGLETGLGVAQNGNRSAQEILSAAMGILRQEPLCHVEYLELRDAETLEPVNCAERDAVLAVAAYVGETRLIDNVKVPAS